MEPTRRTRIAALLLLAVLAASPGVLFAGCAAACPFGKAGRACCRPHGAAPAVRTASCCQTLKATPAETPGAAVPSTVVAFVPAVPVELPGEQPVAEPVAEQPADPPPLHEGIGLYTLHAAFLI
ncbi:MAG TPA: hypothetical protein VGX68_20525 [Thermoanaerobaculia bacterium]|jgi:hypothetical protein|nr:hypothetical protein [Thermoanaerobaculia bacterium]